MRWKLLLEPLGYKPALKNLFASTMVGFLANAAVPRLGEVLKCSLLARYEKLKMDKLVGTIIVERSFDLICFVIFMGFTILLQIDVVGGFVKSKLNSLASSEGMHFGVKILIALLFIVAIIFFITYIFKKYPSNKMLLKINSFYKGIVEGFKSIKHLRHKKLFIAHTIFIWAMYMLQIYIGFFAMEATYHLSIKAAFSVLSLASLAMIATPGGIGSFPIFVEETLAIYYIPNSEGNAFGWLMWGVSTGIVIVVGFTCLLLLPYINKTKNEATALEPQQNI